MADSKDQKKAPEQESKAVAPQNKPKPSVAPNEDPKNASTKPAQNTEPNKDGQQQEQQEDEKKQGLSSKQKMVLIIVGIVLICATVIIVVFLLRSKPEENLLGIPIINAANVEDINRDIDEKVAMGMFETHMNTTWRFPDGKSASSNAIMGNSPNNNFAFYFTVTLNTGETVYMSGLLPVGTQIAEIILEKELSAGTYPAVVGINMVDDEGNPVDSNMGINITLVVEK